MLTKVLAHGEPQSVQGLHMKPSQFAKKQFKIVRAARRHHDVDSVHELRLAIKRLHAILRLLSSSAPAEYRALSAGLRQAHRLLGAHRDKQIYHVWLVSHPQFDTQSRPFSIPHDDIESAAHRVESLRHRIIAAIKGLEVLPKKIKGALRRSVRKAEQARNFAKQSGSDRAFHDWRKRSKDLLYQGQATATQFSLSQRLTRLHKILGDLHDLVVVRDLAVEQSQSQRENLLVWLDREIKRKQAQALRFARDHLHK
jgi:CHAD domain-containing protein